LSLRITSDIESLTPHRNVSVPQSHLAAGLVQRPMTDATTSPTNAGDSVTLEARPQPGELRTALRAGQEDISLNQAADDSLKRVESILTQLRSLIAQGIDDTRPPAGTDAERQYLALVTELAQLGQATAFNDPPLPTVADVPALAERVGQLNGAGLDAQLDAGLVEVGRARESVAAHRELLGHALGTLSIALENTAASRSPITDPQTALQQTSTAQAQILSHANAALSAQSAQSATAALGVLRLLSH
jgi:hypothetical protein